VEQFFSKGKTKNVSRRNFTNTNDKKKNLSAEFAKQLNVDQCPYIKEACPTYIIGITISTMVHCKYRLSARSRDC
jgi:hypothetical protein